MKKRCQSCGMPMDKDPKGGGTNADGSLSKKYCSFCYMGGRFTDNFTTAEEMRVFVKNKMIELGHNKFCAWVLAHGIPYLERWKKS